MQIAFLGFGLIGGSIARAVRANPETKDWTMAAWSPSGEGPRKAAADRVIDAAEAKAEAVLRDADLIVLAGPATVVPSADRPSRRPLAQRSSGRDAIVTDVASTKAAIVERADAAGLWFVGGHPMAGRETAGYEASDADLFVDRPWVVVPGALAGQNDIERVTELADGVPGASSSRWTRRAHDRAVAAISHLPLIVAAALVEAVAIRPGDAKSRAAARAEWPVASGLAAGGWRDTTRVARGDPAMGAAIAVTNAAELGARLRDLRGVLDALAGRARPARRPRREGRDRHAWPRPRRSSRSHE